MEQENQISEKIEEIEESAKKYYESIIYAVKKLEESIKENKLYE